MKRPTTGTTKTTIVIMVMTSMIFMLVQNLWEVLCLVDGVCCVVFVGQKNCNRCRDLVATPGECQANLYLVMLSAQKDLLNSKPLANPKKRS